MASYHASAHRLLAKHQLAPELLSSQIRYALNLLHSNNLVHGDLRRPNILVKGGKAMVIDFDWCSSEGDGRYPGHLNMDSVIGWHPGVKPTFLCSQNYVLMRWR